MPDDFPIWKTLERATLHLATARFGGYGPRARAGLYRRAAVRFMAVAELLIEEADREEGYARAEAMVRQDYASE